jgi:hypothetical protein
MTTFKSGHTFLYSPDGTGEDLHLHIVISNPKGNPPKVLIVSITSQSIRDNTVTFQPGDHSFITKPSVVSYRHLREVLVSTLEGAESAHFRPRTRETIFERREPLSDNIIEKIVDGVFTSPLSNEENGNLMTRYLI